MYLFIFMLFLFFLDYLGKEYALKNLKNNKKKFFNNALTLCYLENRGIAFNILNNKKKIIMLSNIILLIILGHLILSSDELKISFSLIFVGGFGNLFDRIKRGYVIDYFTFKFKKCPVFNLSDFYIILGVLISLLH